MTEIRYDLLIIGGGINGTAIALDAAGRGLKVMLCEANDLASGTSSASTKLIHGGLRYLEQGHFCFVRESLREREILMKKAPHMVHPLNFIMPHSRSLRPAFFIRIGLFLYDHLGGRKLLSHSKRVSLREQPAGQILQESFTIGFRYADCWTNDARLVVLNAIAAKELGASIQTRTKVTAATRNVDHWTVTLTNQRNGTASQINAQIIVNAAGPWADHVLHDELHLSDTQHTFLVKGSHIIVKRIGTQTEALLLQHTDKRIIFVIPYLEQYSLIGTTDLNYESDPADVKISAEEIRYLCDAVNGYLKTPLQPTDVLHSYSGVRSLVYDGNKNASTATRDFHLQLDDIDGQCPILSVFGGKLTTHRQLAEEALTRLKSYFATLQPAWTAQSILPGGDLPTADFINFVADCQQQYHQFDAALIKRYANLYGTRIHTLLENMHNTSELGKHYGYSLYAKEVHYLIEKEFAETAEDILWRRTNLGYFFPESGLAELEIDLKNITAKSII
ncbi:MAG: glycerol-3-phosphate dehydrogenase [Pseudomonadota bacterium]|nr:glycerol-3-phosphate dehydrogenase [Pseudomonadota bacterium]